MNIKQKIERFKEEVNYKKRDLLQKNQALWDTMIFPLQRKGDRMIQEFFEKNGSFIFWGVLIVIILFFLLVLGSILGGLTNMIGGAFP